MITITLQKIREHSPCKEGWETLLNSKGKTAADNEEFPLSDVVESNGINDAFWCLRCLPDHDNLWRLYAVWCAEQVKHLMTDDRSLNALVVARAHANGNATDEELSAASAAARDAAWAAARDAASAAARDAASAAASAASWDAAWAAASAAASAASWDAASAAARDAASAAASAAAWAAAWAAQKEKLIQILNAGKWVD